MSVKYRICDLPPIVATAMNSDHKSRDTKIMVDGKPMIGWQYDEDGNINLFSERVYDDTTSSSADSKSG